MIFFHLCNVCQCWRVCVAAWWKQDNPTGQTCSASYSLLQRQREVSASICVMHTCWGNRQTLSLSHSLSHTHTHTQAFTYVTFTSWRRRPLWSLCDQAKDFWILLNFFSPARIKFHCSALQNSEGPQAWAKRAQGPLRFSAKEQHLNTCHLKL